MSSFDRYLLYLANALVGGTGLVYAWMIYFLEPEGEFAIVNHPWQPHLQHLHIVLAPLLVFAIGHLWYQHAWLFLKSGVQPGRKSGISLLAMALPMVLSGYLIQVVMDDSWRSAWVIVHLATSALWLLAFLAHLFTHRRVRPIEPQRASAQGGIAV